MKTAQIEIDHISAEEVTKAFNGMINQPQQVLDTMGKYLKPAGIEPSGIICAPVIRSCEIVRRA